MHDDGDKREGEISEGSAYPSSTCIERNVQLLLETKKTSNFLFMSIFHICIDSS